MYRALRPLLFRLDPERAHELTLSALRVAARLSPTRPAPTEPAHPPLALMGLRFANRIGLAAGFDKNGAGVDALGRLGFGFIEVGTVTPQPQPGNPRPRVFRVPRAQAIVNQMGFPNDGATIVAARLARRRFTGICGVNISKNAATPMERAVDDYIACLRVLYAHADYLAVNVSSPNTAGLRQLEEGERLGPLLGSLLEERGRLAARDGRVVPLVVKLSPDLAAEDLSAAAAVIASLRIDGVIATNSSVQRPALGGLSHADRPGGLSGMPLRALSIATVARLRALLGPQFPIIGAGGVCSAASARELLAAGADLIEVYSGLIYRGPALVRELIHLDDRTKA
jgi:dihydroorotate dehydrogenase subfamily 2